ncbi:hypothetical protein Tco_1112067 [Tanacetum coccineum]|uniref:Transposase (Putative), gypsy type n=1 Tax=Tanacetum coccineum TaxID=301880 RepID=A0ABQ5INR0_9ASTR
MDTIKLRWGSKSSWGECLTAKSRITCDNTNRNSTLSEAQGVSLRITLGMRVRTVYHDLYLGGKALVERENVGFDLTKFDLYRSFVEDLTAKGVGLRVADSHTGNHCEDGFTPLETIRRFLAYGCEPSVDLFRGFFNSFPGGKWLIFAKRPEKHIPNLLPKVITRIEGWKGHFFFVQDSMVPTNFSELLSKDNRWDTNVHVFPDPILFMAGLKPSWDHGQQCPTIIIDRKEMAFRNFIYAETDKDLSFLPKEPSPDFGTGSSSVSVNTEPPIGDAEPAIQLVENTTYSRDSSCQGEFVIHPESVAARIKDRKCKMRGGSSRPTMKRKLAQGSSSSRATCAKTTSSKDATPLLTISDDDEGLLDVLELQNANACHHKIFSITPPAWKNHLDNHLDVELLDLHDQCYFRQAVVDNAVNRRSRELLKVASLEAEKARLEAVEASLCQEVDDVKHDRMKVVLKVVPYISMELVAEMKEPFDLTKVKGYRPSYKKEHTKARNDIATATFPFLSEVVADCDNPSISGHYFILEY